jgi:hypothetical protein
VSLLQLLRRILEHRINHHHLRSFLIINILEDSSACQATCQATEG